MLWLVGWYQVIHKEWRQTLWCVGLKLHFCVVFLMCSEEIPPPSLSISLFLCLFCFQLPQKHGKAQPAPVFPSGWASSCLLLHFRGLGLALWIHHSLASEIIPFHTKSTRSSRNFCVSSLFSSSGWSTPALKCLYWLSVTCRTGLETFLLLGYKMWTAQCSALHVSHTSLCSFPSLLCDSEGCKIIIS